MRKVLLIAFGLWCVCSAARAQVPPLPTLPPPLGATPTPEFTPIPFDETPVPTAEPTPMNVIDLRGDLIELPDVPATAGPSILTPAPPRPNPTGVPRPVDPTAGIELSLAGAYALSSGGALLAAVLFPAVFVFVRPTRRRFKEVVMPAALHRWRLLAGAGLIVVATIIAIAGYLKISLEPNFARQVPYLASAGMATLILVVAGGALVMADQIRAEDDRITEIEAAVAKLADLMRGEVESPARLRE